MAVDVLLDVGIKSPFQRRKPKNTILLKKQVKFTDDLKSCSDVLTTVGAEKMILDNLKVAEADDPLEGLLFYAIDSF
jgi:hypothetical protein